MDRGEDVFLDDLFGNQYGILEVVSPPGHEGHEHVPAEGKFAGGGGRPVGDHLATHHFLAQSHDRLLVDARVLVGAPELDEIVDIRTVFSACVRLVGSDYDTAGVDGFHRSAPPGFHRGTRVAGNNGLHPRSHERGFRAQQRYGLPLHVGSHERAVCVIMLQERNERRRNGNQLVRGNVHEGDIPGAYHGELAFLPCDHDVPR